MLAAFPELDARADDQAADRLGDEYLAGRGLCPDARAEVHCHAANVVADALALTSVQAGAQLDGQRRDRLLHRTRAADCGDGSVEDGEQPVAE